MSEDPFIRVRGAGMSYPVPVRWTDLPRRIRGRERVTALVDVDLDVVRGGRLGVLGPNGAGKSTLVRLLAGILYPTRGTVHVGGADTRLENEKARARIGLVINEERSFYWRLTGRENLEFFGALENMTGAGLRSRIEEVVELVGLSAAAGERVSGYSSGMKQRLAIARALLPDPEVLILDEPTRSLDPLGAREMRQLLHRVAGGRKTLVVATNALDDVPALCDRFVVLAAGRIAGAMDVDGNAAAEIAAFYGEHVVTTG